MPMRPKRPCGYPGCCELVSDGSRCDKHKKQEQQRYDKERGTAHERGYDANHRRLRKIVLAEEPLCRHCLEKGITTASNEMDHIDGNSRNLKRSNLQGLCKPCHSRKTIKEQGALRG